MSHQIETVKKNYITSVRHTFKTEPQISRLQRIASSIPLAHKFRQCSFPIYIIAIKETTLKISKQKNNEISERQFLILFNTDSQLEFSFHNASKAESTLSMHPEKKKKGVKLIGTAQELAASKEKQIKRQATKFPGYRRGQRSVGVDNQIIFLCSSVVRSCPICQWICSTITITQHKILDNFPNFLIFSRHSCLNTSSE